MKQKIFWIAFVAMLFMVKYSSYGQTPLEFNNKEATIATNDEKYRIPTTFIEPLPKSTGVPCTLKEVQEVRSAHAWIGLDSNIFQWTTSSPVGGGGDVNNGYAQLNVPGLYHISIMRKSDGAIWLLDITVSYISDPWTGVDVPAASSSPHLSSFGGTITAEKEVNLKIHSIFSAGNFVNELIKVENGTVQSMGYNQNMYQVSATGRYALSVGYSGSPSYSYDVYFDVDISTIPVQSVSLNKTSLIKTVGEPAETLIATINPSNATNKNVSWSTNNSNVATVVDGTVGFVGVGQATITVTTQDGNKTATCDVTVNAKTYTLTASAGSGGTISPSGSVTVNQGVNQTFTATPDNGKMIDQWKVDGNGVANAGNTYTVSNVQANATVQVTFKEVPPVTFTLTATAGSGGTISPSGSVTVNQGGSQTFTATPDNGKMIDEWKVDGNTVANAGDAYTVSNVQANATVQVTFKDVPPATFTLTATAGSGGTIFPSGSVTVNQGGSQTFTATPDNGKMIDEWKVDSNTVTGAEDTYTVSNVQENATVQVTFKDVPPVEESLFPVFDGLEGEYVQSTAAIPLKLKGKDSEKFTIFKVNGEVKTEFTPNEKGSFKIEAITADGKSRIETCVNVK